MALILELKVIPLAKQKKVLLDKGGMLKCYVNSAPERGKANKEVIEMIAAICKVSKKSVDILFGETSRSKRIRIDTDMTEEQFLEKLGSGVQRKLF